MTTTELLISHGFSYAGQKFCCGGQKNDIFFDDKGAEIHVRTKAKIFRVVQEKIRWKSPWHDLSGLETKLNEIKSFQQAP